MGGDKEDEARDINTKNNYLYTIGSTSSKGEPNGDIHFLKLDAKGNILLETMVYLYTEVKTLTDALKL